MKHSVTLRSIAVPRTPAAVAAKVAPRSWRVLLPACLALLLVWPQNSAEAVEPPPNVIIIFTDDQGYGDVGVFGAEGYQTPHLDRMAAEGVRFTDFYVSNPVCTASRAALMTGCYHVRVGLQGALGPRSELGLNPDEVTIADMLKAQGYHTACFGKWHLGRPPELLPAAQGFDEYFGIPYSNDMWPYHPENPQAWPDLPLIEGTEVVNPAVTAEDQQQFTTWFTERAVEFIDRHHEEPFFIYLAHPQPHVPLFVSDKFAGTTELGLYGDVIAELDWSVGEVLAALERHGIGDRTLVVFTSDNGPWLSYGDHAGSAGPLREGKGTTWDGGTRVPFIARWPGTIPAGGVVSEPAMTIDLLPTIAHYTGAELPEWPIDGRNIAPLLEQHEDAASPHEALFFFHNTRELQAVRSGPWKLVFPHRYRTMDGQEPGRGGIPGRYRQRDTGLALYRVDTDPGEGENLAPGHPEVVRRLSDLADDMRLRLGTPDGHGTENREPGRAQPVSVTLPADR